jgi:hypothetical protein
VTLASELGGARPATFPQSFRRMLQGVRLKQIGNGLPPFERLATEPRLSHEDLPRVNQRRQRAAIIPRRPAKSGSLWCAGHARRHACERLSAGWRVPAEPTMLRLNSHVLGF